MYNDVAARLDESERHSGVYTVWTLIGADERIIMTGLTSSQTERLIRRLNDVYGDTEAWAEED